MKRYILFGLIIGLLFFPTNIFAQDDETEEERGTGNRQDHAREAEEV